MPTVFVIAQDWNLRAGVRAELRERGVEALGMESPDVAAKELARGTVPAAAVLEAGTGDAASASLAELARRVPVIVVASRSLVETPLVGAAAVLWRPVSVGEIVARVREILEGRAA